MTMRTITKLSAVGIMLFGAALVSGQGHPSHQLTNGEITATVYLPDAKNGFYTTTRFDWSGAIATLCGGPTIDVGARSQQTGQIRTVMDVARAQARGVDEHDLF